MKMLVVLCWFALVFGGDFVRCAARENGDSENSNAENSREENGEICRNVTDLLRFDDFEKLDQFRKTLLALPEKEKRELALRLSGHLESKKELPISRPQDMAVKSRVEAGKMKWHGHGMLLKHDVLSEGGRCAWVIESLLETDLPKLEFQLTKDDYSSRVKEIRSLAKKFAGK